MGNSRNAAEGVPYSFLITDSQIAKYTFMRIIQFELPGMGRRVGVVNDDNVLDITAGIPEFRRTYDIFRAARSAGKSLNEFINNDCLPKASTTIAYPDLLETEPNGDKQFLRPPLDHEDPHYLLITGTGLTHTGSMKSRDSMHSDTAKQEDKPMTDSAKMFQMGIEGGKPADGERGAAPEWFYKGNGTNLRGYGDSLDLPAFARDGGEEPEIVGCYIIDEDGVPRRLGFALGNEWSDHETEKINYLYLAPSKLRTCAVGPELRTDIEFIDIRLNCLATRNGETIYDSGELFSGEEYMCHSLANCEDHHFKYPEHRRPGDIHLHYFGTSKLSFSTRDWKYQEGDEIRVESKQFGAPLVNRVNVAAHEARYSIAVQPA